MAETMEHGCPQGMALRPLLFQSNLLYHVCDSNLTINVDAMNCMHLERLTKLLIQISQ